MTRFVRVVLMLAFAFAQAAAAECPMAPAGHEHASAATNVDGAHAHGHHTSPSNAPAHSHDAPDHGPAACVLAMTCGTAAVAGSSLAVPRPALRPAPAVVAAAERYASPHLPIDAPPPRPVAAA